MTATRPEAATAPASDAAPAAGPPVLEEHPGLAGWLTTGDHKRIGRLYLLGAALFLLTALVVAALLGFERIDDGGLQLLDGDAIVQMFALYRYELVFGALLPALMGLAVAAVPLQVGARGIAFPRAAALSLWVWLMGASLMIAAIAMNGGPGGGDQQGVDLFIAALGVTAAGLVLGAVCVATTVLTLRAPGMRLDRVPLFAWASLVWAVMLLLGLAVLIGLCIYLYVDHHYAKEAFGGNEELGQYLTWSVRAPQVFLYVLPALGIIADITATASRRRQIGRGTLLFLVALGGIVGFGAWAQEAFGVDVMKDPIFVVAVLLCSVPILGVLAMAGGMLTGGTPRLLSPVVFAVSGLLMLLLGGVAAALWPIDGLDLQGTVYEQGYVNAAVFGALLVAMGGVVYWAPKLWGRLVPDRPASGLAVLGLVGAIAAAVPDLILGFLGQPEGTVDDLATDTSALWNALTMVGYGLLFLVVLAFVLLVVRSAMRGKSAGDDPWDGQTLEWATSSPPPPGNFAELPVVRSAAPLLDRKEA